MNCDTCKERQKQEPVPAPTHEADMARMERIVKRLWIALILCIAGLIGMFIYEARIVDTTTTIEAEQQTAEGGNNYAVSGDLNGMAEG